MSRVRTRFAPSPTGSLHVGNARTAVLNWLIARHHGGRFVLRIEDTDVERNVPGAEARLMADLRWLGLDWDEGPAPDEAGGGERGGHGPYRQSRRREVYDRRARELLDSGSAYRCFCDPATLEAERERARADRRSPHYAGTCRGVAPEESAGRAAAGEPHVLRLATPTRGSVVVADIIRGDVTFDAATIGDFVLVRSDGVPTYNFAVVVDDAAMQISHVIRGAGHLSNTPHQLLIYSALGLEPPAFAHTPTVLGEDRSKLSKRSGARPLHELRKEGLHPDGLLNYLSLLGWSSPSEDEVLERERLIEEVSLDRVHAGDVVYDPEKMRWISGQHIARMSPEALEAAVRPYVERSRFAPLLERHFPVALAAVRSHLTAFGEITEHLTPFIGPEEPPRIRPEERPVVAEVARALAEVESWSEEAVAGALKAAGRAAGARGRALYVPVRRALTAAEHGPPLPAIVVVQGKEAVLTRLQTAAERRDGAGEPAV